MAWRRGSTRGGTRPAPSGRNMVCSYCPNGWLNAHAVDARLHDDLMRCAAPSEIRTAGLCRCFGRKPCPTFCTARPSVGALEGVEAAAVAETVLRTVPQCCRDGSTDGLRAASSAPPIAVVVGVWGGAGVVTTRPHHVGHEPWVRVVTTPAVWGRVVGRGAELAECSN